MGRPPDPRELVAWTADQLLRAYRWRRVTARQYVELCLERMDALEPKLNAVITRTSDARGVADSLDRAHRRTGRLQGPLHGVPIVVKDQIDVGGSPTTLGSILFRDHVPGQDAFVVTRLRNAGAIILAKGTLGEFGRGETMGSLFGVTHNPYDLERTAGGSSGGPAVSVAAGYSTLGLGQEGLASIRRPATWTGIVGMRPSARLVSRTGIYGGWPDVVGTAGPMARSVSDAARLLDAIAGYDADDPLSLPLQPPRHAFGAGLGRRLSTCRIGIIRQPMGIGSEPDSDDFLEGAERFDRTVDDMRRAGAEIIDLVVPDLRELLAKRARRPGEQEASFAFYAARSGSSPFRSRAAIAADPNFGNVVEPARRGWFPDEDEDRFRDYLAARSTLLTRLLTLFHEHRLDVVAHNSMEHSPTRLTEVTQGAFIEHRGAPTLNTFLSNVPAITVPSGRTQDGLPMGITFMGRPYDDRMVLEVAKAYETFTRQPAPGQAAAARGAVARSR